MEISFTIDLEDPTGVYAENGRYVPMTYRILDLCDSVGGRKATFFSVGRVAKANAGLIRNIASRGHEIAFHSHNHVSLTEEERARFFLESKEDKDRLEQISGTPVVGFRAPRFSLTPATAWTLDVLAEIGFKYSSSIMPTAVSLFGFPEAKRTSFFWPCGMKEFPLPVAQVGRWRIPYLGGIYLYDLPMFVVRHFLSKASQDEVLWTYTHPYDFDRDQPFSPMPDTPLWVGAVLWEARRRASGKIAEILRISPGSKRLCDRV
ncbi:MAG: polysaccharide deacetylase family protein [Alphaproteobacteria bacterium]|nr:polysaccharide deacetylase family protein [Alphaproteobacteria bacterium]